jgi:RNA polymerase sigma-70 factor (ECF subfamily)
VRIIQKDEFAFLIKQYERLVFSVCFSFTRNYFDAEDLAQDTFLSAYKNLESFKGENLKAYLTTIAANKCRDYLKRFERKNVPLSEEENMLEDARGSPEEAALRHDSSMRIHNLCERLDEPYKTVAISYFLKDEKLSEISKRTGQNLKTLQTRLYRAKAMLKSMWKEDAI